MVMEKVKVLLKNVEEAAPQADNYAIFIDRKV